MKQRTFVRASLATLSSAALAAATARSGGGDSGSSDAAGPGGEIITIGFSQVGTESRWRAANTKDIQETLTEENGFKLSFTDAQQKQETQIRVLRSCIAQGVDVHAFSPVLETGWNAVLQEAKAANIPVVLTDRAVDTTDDSLYASFIGSDSVEEGQRAGFGKLRAKRPQEVRA